MKGQTMLSQINRKMQMVFVLVLFLLDVAVTRQNDRVNDDRYQSRRGQRKSTGQKLLIIVIDG